MKMIQPIMTIDLFPKLDRKLIKLLKSFSKQDWERQTIVPLWNVKDIAFHLLDGNIRSLSILRDNYVAEHADNINSYEDLVLFLDRLNADWIKAMKRVSPNILIELLEITGVAYNNYLDSLDPYQKATFSVAWAGEKESYNWFHIAREYTEKWHHQQQIRLAVGKERELYAKDFYFPYLDTSMRALPHHYGETKADKGELIKFSVSGEGGGHWFLSYANKSWELAKDCSDKPTCEVVIDEEIAWRIFTKGIHRKDAEKSVKISGTKELGNKIFEMIAVMA
jgi:hypothetical protein